MNNDSPKSTQTSVENTNIPWGQSIEDIVLIQRKKSLKTKFKTRLSPEDNQRHDTADAKTH